MFGFNKIEHLSRFLSSQWSRTRNVSRLPHFTFFGDLGIATFSYVDTLNHGFEKPCTLDELKDVIRAEFTLIDETLLQRVHLIFLDQPASCYEQDRHHNMLVVLFKTWNVTYLYKIKYKYNYCTSKIFWFTSICFYP